MITKLTVVRLNKTLTQEYNFNNDLNIFSGKNGSGKTTLLKLMWYVMSGNFKMLFEEIEFEMVRLDFLDGDYIKLTVKIIDGVKRVKIEGKGDHPELENDFVISQLDPSISIQPDAYSSLFFPTFRRIEGGFSTVSRSRKLRSSNKDSLAEAFEDISAQMSYVSSDTEHRFIASISTTDIKSLLSNKYSKISAGIRQIEETQSKDILATVTNSKDREKQALEEIREIVRLAESNRNEMLKPFSILSEFIDRIFKNKSIDVVNNIKLGTSEEIISSEHLSAGEKQMLSFLCYNFFYDNTVIFIDEPELSLHTDWQRILFPTLLKLQKNNQFIIATHSPFIYTMYPDKEIILDTDKGDNDE